MAREVEVKFHIRDPQSMSDRLAKNPAIFVKTEFEHNTAFDTEDHRIYGRRALLRLRRTDRTTLTYKHPPAEVQEQFKVYDETEVQVDDFDAMCRILNRLGFFGVQTYEKYRTTYRMGPTLITMDTMPYGHFMEIEGEEADIRRIAGELGLAWEDRILENYLGIFETLKKKLDLPFSDLTFEHFKDRDIDFSLFESLFTAGAARP